MSTNSEHQPAASIMPPTRRDGEDRIRLSRHDRLQLEIKVQHQTTENLKTPLQSELDLWFFLPSASGVGPGNYDRESFYEDLRIFTRLKTPTFSLQQLCDPEDIQAPMGRLYQRIKALPDGTLPKKREGALVRDCKLLVVAARTALRVDLEPDLDGCESEPAFHSTQQLAHLARDLLDQFRTLRPQLKQRSLRKRTRRCLSFADEYLSMLVEYAAVEAMIQLEELKQEGGEAESSYLELQELAQRETAYRKGEGWRSVLSPDPADPLGDAAYVDQASLLKKYFSSVLHLHVQRDKTGGWVEHIALGLAAALAMTWAIGLQIFTFFALDLDLSQNMGSGLVMLFAGIAVAGYILKDRIKATVAIRLSKRIPLWLSDRRNSVCTFNGALAFARIEEWMNFVHTDEIPKTVQRKRLATARSRLVAEAEVDVLHYRRCLHIEPKKARTEIEHFEGLSDIIRVNTWRWIRTFAETKKPIQILNAQGKPVTVKAPNEYVVDLLYQSQIGSTESEKTQSSEVRKARLFLNRRGILRIEPVDD